MPYWRGFSRRIGQKRRGTRFLWRFNDFTELLVTIVRLIKFAGERSSRGTRVSFSFLHGKNKQPFLPPPANYANHRIKGIIVADEHEVWEGAEKRPTFRADVSYTISTWSTGSKGSQTDWSADLDARYGSYKYRWPNMGARFSFRVGF